MQTHKTFVRDASSNTETTLVSSYLFTTVG